MVELVWKVALAMPIVIVGLSFAAFYVADWMNFVVFIARPIGRLYRALRGQRP